MYKNKPFLKDLACFFVEKRTLLKVYHGKVNKLPLHLIK